MEMKRWEVLAVHWLSLHGLPQALSIRIQEGTLVNICHDRAVLNYTESMEHC